MQNNEFIKYFTGGKCLSFSDFLKISQEYGISFEKINNEIVVCYNGEGNWREDSYNFYKYFFPETELKPSSFDLISSINIFHKKFIRNRTNDVYKAYGLPPMYDDMISIRDNAILLLNTLKIRTAILREDIEFIKYMMTF